MMRLPSTRVIAVVCLLSACGGGSTTSPTAPTPPPPVPQQQVPPAAPSGLRLVDLSLPDRSVVVEWNGSINATGYVVRWASADGQKEIETDGSSTRATLTNLVTDQRASVLVGARNAAGTSALIPIAFYIPEFRDVVEALFLGTGPYGEPGVGAPASWGGRMGGWVPGANVPVRVDRSFSSQKLDAVTRFLREIGDLTSGYVHGYVAEVGSVRPALDFTFGEIKVFQTDDFTAICPSAPDAAGCAPRCQISTSPFLIPCGLAVVKPGVATMVLSHELGHLFGLHHVVVAAAWHVGPTAIPRATMGLGPGVIPDGQTLAPVEAEAFRRVYGAGLRPGALRSDFYSRGLIRHP